jgi:hypothetical protein
MLHSRIGLGNKLDVHVSHMFNRDIWPSKWDVCRRPLGYVSYWS